MVQIIEWNKHRCHTILVRVVRFIDQVLLLLLLQLSLIFAISSVDGGTFVIVVVVFVVANVAVLVVVVVVVVNVIVGCLFFQRQLSFGDDQFVFLIAAGLFGPLSTFVQSVGVLRAGGWCVVVVMVVLIQTPTVELILPKRVHFLSERR